MDCCRPNRRRLIQLAGAVALLPMMGAMHVGRARAAGVLAARDLEVVTVTDTAAIVTWTTTSPDRLDAAGRPLPLPADTELRIGPADSSAPPRVVLHDDTRTPFHYAEVHGLEPGRTYRFEAYSDGVAPSVNSVATARPGTPEATGTFTTLTPPPGKLVGTLALANDVHYGEEVSGLIVGQVPPGFRQDPGAPPYPQVMLDAVLDDLDRRGIGELLLAGDLTAEASPRDSRDVRARLDAWRGRYLACRGNHDRPHRGAEYATCAPLPSGHFDCWGEQFVPRQQLRSTRVGQLRILGIDTTELDAAGGAIEPEQMAQIRDELRADPDRPTVVFGHHPATVEAATTNLAGPAFVLRHEHAHELQALYARAPGVFLHHAGHTHRNRRTGPDHPGLAVEFLEVGAVKEYPGGYSVLRLYEGGYMVNFYKTRSEASRAWSYRTRGEYLGFFPEYSYGTFADRNHVVRRDLSGL